MNLESDLTHKKIERDFIEREEIDLVMVVVVLGEGGRLVRESLSLLLPFSSVLLEELRASRFTRDL